MVSDKVHRISRAQGTRRPSVFIAGYVLELAIFYLLSSVIRLLSGRPGNAWVPDSAVLGAWAGFALWSLMATVIAWLVNRRREHRETKRRQ